MARVNIGIDPHFLSDQHLIAESVEITMITGGLRKNGYQIKSEVPKYFTLGKGHINFFKNKLGYLHNRLWFVNQELNKRGIKNSTDIDLQEYPPELCNGWIPDHHSSMIIRERIFDRLIHPKKAKPGFHKYYKKSIDDIEAFAYHMVNSKLFEV